MTELLLHERQAHIQERLAQSGRVLAADLAADFGVSEDTIRRDLREMAAAGLCKRVYGGALRAVPEPSPLAERDGEQAGAKAALAAALFDLIAPGMTMFLDASSINMALARLIAARGDALTAITNTPAIAAILMGAPAVEVIVIGGPIDRRVSAAVGARALRDAELLRPDLCVLGACGIAAKVGVTALYAEDAEFKRVIAGRSRTVGMGVTMDKLGTVAAHDVVALEDVDAMAVEHEADDAALAPYAASGMKILRAAERH